MNATASLLQPSVPTRLLAGVSVPDTSLVARAIELAEKNAEPFLFNHVMRSWLFAVALAELDRPEYDAEVLAIATVLHDVGLAKALAGPLRFEVAGANAARDFARQQGVDNRRAQLIWDGVALNSSPSIALFKEPEVALCTAGTVLDWSGQGAERLRKTQVDSILAAFPRLEMKQRFTDAVYAVVETRPETTYDNFARDFGERFVPGYKARSTVDYLWDAPFKE
jgi:hypothetical protein